MAWRRREFKEEVKLPDGINLGLLDALVGRARSVKYRLIPIKVSLTDSEGVTNGLSVASALAQVRGEVQEARATTLRGGLYVTITMDSRSDLFHGARINGRDEATVRGVAALMRRDIERFGTDPHAFVIAPGRLARAAAHPWVLGIGVTVIGTLIATGLLKVAGVL